MKRNRVLTSTVALWLLVQMVTASGAMAEELSPAMDVFAGLTSAVATVIALPVKLVACGATLVLGGTAYGLTMGGSEFLRQELVAGMNYNCGGKFYITPQEIKQFAREPDRRR